MSLHLFGSGDDQIILIFIYFLDLGDFLILISLCVMLCMYMSYIAILVTLDLEHGIIIILFYIFCSTLSFFMYMDI